MTSRLLPDIDQIRRAAEQLRSVIVRTPLVPYRSEDSSEPGVGAIYLKPEILQPVTSFKLRGVFYALATLTPAERGRGVSTVSAGNTAQALAWAARHFGIPARSVMPEGAPRTKIDAVRALGGTPVLVPGAEVFAYLRERRWESEPYAFVHPWTDRRVWTGHATLGLEIAEDLPEVESVFVPVGGGGLLAGVGSALRALRPGFASGRSSPRAARRCTQRSSAVRRSRSSRRRSATASPCRTSPTSCFRSCDSLPTEASWSMTRQRSPPSGSCSCATS